MSTPRNQTEAPYSDDVLPAFTPINHEQRSEAATSLSSYRPNPAFRPPHREPFRHNVYDIPDADDGPPRPALKKMKRSGRPAIPSTPVGSSQTTTPPDSKKQTKRTGIPGQATNKNSFPNTTVSKPSFSQHRSHSVNDKSSSNLHASAPAAKKNLTTTKFPIAMTTMEKLAAFRYQPSSTGSVHKAIASSNGLSNGNTPDGYNIPGDLENGRRRSQSFFASMLSNAAVLSTVPSSYGVEEDVREYHSGPQDADIHPPNAANRQNRGLTPENLVPQETILCANQESRSDEPPAEPDYDMLDYESFDDLAAEPWNHMDYVAHDNPDGDQIFPPELIQNGGDNMDLESAEDSKPWPTSEFNEESGMKFTEDEDRPVHSNGKLANADRFNEERPSPLVEAASPGEDTEDYFAALGEFDDEDFAESNAFPSNNDATQTTRVCYPDTVATVPELEDEDYLAAFADFNDEDFQAIKIPPGHEEVQQHQTVAGNLIPIVQVPAAHHRPQAQDNHYPHTTTNAMAVCSPAFPQGSRDDSDEDEYPLDEEEQAELEHLITSKHEAVLETRKPPSSIFHSEEDMRDMEIYDKRLKYSPVVADQAIAKKPQEYRPELVEPLADPEDWEFLREARYAQASHTATTVAVYTNFANAQNSFVTLDHETPEDENYRPLPLFARPPFPKKVPARSPVTGISSNLLLRTCFRIGEALSQASLCSRDNQDAVTELFARVTFSARETDGKKQNFQFGDIFHNKPPFVSGVLEKYASSDMQQTESSELITVGKEKENGELGDMVRVLGRVKRVIQGRGYTMEILNIRKTDWEEVRFTKRVLGA